MADPDSHFGPNHASSYYTLGQQETFDNFRASKDVPKAESVNTTLQKAKTTLAYSDMHESEHIRADLISPEARLRIENLQAQAI
jgi:hypothetical protein